MNSILAKLVVSAALAFGLVSCAEIASPGYGGGYGGSYGSGYSSGYGSSYHGGGSRYYDDGYGYRNDYHHDHDDYRYRDEQRHSEPPKKAVLHEHCYCSHKSCGCKPGHPKSGCDCDHGAHRHDGR